MKNTRLIASDDLASAASVVVVGKGGRVRAKVTTALVTPCPMDFVYYPFDSHVCFLDLR